MTYYSTRGGARVFAAGVLDFGYQANAPTIGRLIANIFEKLKRR
jgi:hypothetical protein